MSINTWVSLISGVFTFGHKFLVVLQAIVVQCHQNIQIDTIIIIIIRTTSNSYTSNYTHSMNHKLPCGLAIIIYNYADYGYNMIWSPKPVAALLLLLMVLLFYQMLIWSPKNSSS